MIVPNNFGHVDISPQSGVHQDWTPTQWTVDDDGNIVLTVITNSWPLDNLTHYSKITKMVHTYPVVEDIKLVIMRIQVRN